MKPSGNRFLTLDKRTFSGLRQMVVNAPSACLSAKLIRGSAGLVGVNVLRTSFRAEHVRAHERALLVVERLYHTDLGPR